MPPRPRTRVYVDRDQRGKGIGRALLAELLTLASAHGFHSVIARIAGHNETSIGLHRAAGFELVGVEREVGRKHRQWLDVVELQRAPVGQPGLISPDVQPGLEGWLEASRGLGVTRAVSIDAP